jgi:hypothetical protein
MAGTIHKVWCDRDMTMLKKLWTLHEANQNTSLYKHECGLFEPPLLQETSYTNAKLTELDLYIS